MDVPRKIFLLVKYLTSERNGVFTLVLYNWDLFCLAMMHSSKCFGFTNSQNEIFEEVRGWDLPDPRKGNDVLVGALHTQGSQQRKINMPPLLMSQCIYSMPKHACKQSKKSITHSCYLLKIPPVFPDADTA